MILPLGSRYSISSEGYILNDRLQQKYMELKPRQGNVLYAISIVVRVNIEVS